MKETFIKKYWEEEDVVFYLHFQEEKAVRQIEESSEGVFLTSEEMPFTEKSMLYDQSLSELELNQNDFISESIFLAKWENYG